MNYIDTLICGIIGCVIGYFAPKLCNWMIGRKLTQRGRQRETSFLDQQATVVLFIIGNGIVWAVSGFFANSIVIAFLIGILATMAVIFTIIDMLIHIIPNEMLLIGLPVAVAFQLTEFGLNHFLIALACMAIIVVMFTILGLIIGLAKIGAGDVKLAGLMGLTLGYPLILYAVLIMSIALIIYCIVGMSLGKLTHVSMFPFAPFLMLGLASGLVLVLFPNIVGLVIS